MKHPFNSRLRFAHFAPLLFATALAGCVTASSTPPPTLAPDAHDLAASARDGQSSRFVYVSDPVNDAVFVFDQRGKIQFDITALRTPQGLFVDASDDLWVANSGATNILEFAKRGTTPIATYNDAVGYPVDVTQCPNGQIYVSDLSRVPSGEGSIGVYTPGNPDPVGRLGDPDESGNYYVTCDVNDNVFSTVTLRTGGGSVDEYPGGSINGFVRLPIKLSFPGGIRADQHGHLFVDDQGKHRITEYTNSGLPTGKSIRTGPGDVVGIDISPDGHTVAGANTLTGEADTWSFPSGNRGRRYVLPPSWPTLTPVGFAYDLQ